MAQAAGRHVQDGIRGNIPHSEPPTRGPVTLDRKRKRVVEDGQGNRRMRKHLHGSSPYLATRPSSQQAQGHRRESESQDPLLSRIARERSESMRQSSIYKARIEYWMNEARWPTEEEDEAMQRFQDNYLRDVLPRKKSSASLRRKRSESSITNEQKQREKTAPYRLPQYEREHQERGSFVEDDDEGITARSKQLCRTLLTQRESRPEGTIFSDEKLFLRTCKRLRSENEMKVMLDIGMLIVPRAEPLADRGAKHLEIVRETIDALWTNSIPFYGSRPWPDYALGFKREAFDQDRLRKLNPFIGNEVEDCSYVAVTPNMFYPFLCAEVKSEAAALVFADRQNLGNMSTALQNLVKLYRLVGREMELHREISGWSISYSLVDIRIWAHYIVIDGKEQQFRRHPIAMVNIESTELDEEQMDTRKKWIPHDFVMNLYDTWVEPHFARICSVIDMLPNFDVAELDANPFTPQEATSSGLSQGFGQQGLNEAGITSSKPQVDEHHITPETSIQSGGSKRKKTSER